MAHVQDAADEFRAQVRYAVWRIATLSPQPDRNAEDRAKMLRSILRVARKAMERNDDPTIDEKRLADFINFLEKETKKDKPSKAALRKYLRDKADEQGRTS